MGEHCMKECKIDVNKVNCTCTYSSCSRMGICCECLSYHYRNGELPGCLFPKDIERTYDRSIEKFVETFRTRGPWW